MIRLLILGTILFSSLVHADLASVADFYRARYGVSSVIEDYITNDNLANTKRMKVALDGILYWSGTTYGSRAMGKEGLVGLCEEGFSKAIYVYAADHELEGVSCSRGSMDYLNILYSSKANYSALENFLRLVKDRIENPDAGPILLHCWNGIHATSQMAAIAMRQFCGISVDDAVKVFRENSVGTWAKYPHVGRGIENFKPYADITITPKQRQIVCGTVDRTF